MMDKETMPQTLGSSQESLDRFLGPSSSLSCTPRNLCKEEKSCSMAHLTNNKLFALRFRKSVKTKMLSILGKLKEKRDTIILLSLLCSMILSMFLFCHFMVYALQLKFPRLAEKYHTAISDVISVQV